MSWLYHEGLIAFIRLGGDGYGFSPDPDGTKILFSGAEQEGHYYEMEIYLMDLTTGVTAQLTDNDNDNDKSLLRKLIDHFSIVEGMIPPKPLNGGTCNNNYESQKGISGFSNWDHCIEWFSFGCTTTRTC